MRASNAQSYAKCGPLMQQGRNAAESAFIRPKPALARKPARNGVGFKEIAPQPGDRRRHGRFRPIENCVPSAI